MVKDSDKFINRAYSQTVRDVVVSYLEGKEVSEETKKERKLANKILSDSYISAREVIIVRKLVNDMDDYEEIELADNANNEELLHRKLFVLKITCIDVMV